MRSYALKDFVILLDSTALQDCYSDIIFGEFIARNAATGRPIQVPHFSSKSRPQT